MRRRLVTCALVCHMIGVAGVADEWHGLNAGAVVWNGATTFTENKASKISATGCRAVRINFRLDYPTRTTWDASLLATYDNIIDRADRHGLVVLGLLSNESVLRDQTQWNAPPDADGMNAYVPAFADTALLLIERYKDRGKRWKDWNDPSCWRNPNWFNDPQNAGCTYVLPPVYANLLAETYRICELTDDRKLLSDNGITLCSGGLLAHDIGGGFSTAMDYMQRVYDQTQVWNAFETEAGRRYPWDFFGYHYYLAGGTSITTSKLNAYFNAVRNTQSANNDPTPILLTEFGWNTASLSETLQRNNMRTAYDHMETLSYIAGTYWYQWTDEPFPNLWGITRTGEVPKLSHAEFVTQNGTPPPSVSIASQQSAISPDEEFVITANVTLATGASIASVEIHWGDEVETLGTLPSPASHVFTTVGTHSVYVVVEDSNGQSGTSNTLSVDVSLPPFAPGDFDQDGDVDQADYGRFQACLTGGGRPQLDPACLAARLDVDSDVDIEDFGIFQACFSGPGNPADPTCATIP